MVDFNQFQSIIKLRKQLIFRVIDYNTSKKRPKKKRFDHISTGQGIDLYKLAKRMDGDESSSGRNKKKNC